MGLEIKFNAVKFHVSAKKVNILVSGYKNPPGFCLSCCSASSNMIKILSVSSGLLPTTVKPFHTYIISCGKEIKSRLKIRAGLTTMLILRKQECTRVLLTRAGTTSFTGLEEEYRCAFFAANFSVGIDFPAILILKPSTCLRNTIVTVSV